ncbi:PREDICTED: protein unc-93 homolog A-like, partial [Priapulus caudatus]|uniref:Protein unc-93 homolog A-like n=1 Tax=Priapulus caudatus TaxID=37621 RepID=A0ABM1EZ59_PRICU
MIGERHPRPSTSYHHSSAIAESIEESPDSSPVSPRSSRCNSASHRATLAVARRDSTSSPPAATSPSSAVLPVAASPTDSGSAARSSSVTSPRESALAHAIRLSLSDINSLSARRARSVSCYGAYPLQAIALTALPGAHLHLHAAAAAAAAQEPKRRRGTLCKQIRAVKNLLVLALTFLLTFTGFNALRNHASVLQRDASASLVSLCVFYACMSVSGVASAVVTNRLTPKWTIVVAFACYSVYFAANLLPNYYTLVPTAAFAGAMSGPLWNAQTLYLYATARKYAFLTEEIPERVLNRFNRVFGAVYWCSVVVGNIIALLIFTRSDKTAELTDVGRSLRVWAAASACGAAACQAHKPVRYNFTLSYDNGVGGGNIDSVFLLVGIFVGCGLLATALAVGLMDRLEPTAHHVGTRRRSSRFLFNRMLRVMQDSRILVLMVLIFFTGLEQGFIFADFTK